MGFLRVFFPYLQVIIFYAITPALHGDAVGQLCLSAVQSHCWDGLGRGSPDRPGSPVEVGDAWWSPWQVSPSLFLYHTRIKPILWGGGFFTDSKKSRLFVALLSSKWKEFETTWTTSFRGVNVPPLNSSQRRQWGESDVFYISIEFKSPYLAFNNFSGFQSQSGSDFFPEGRDDCFIAIFVSHSLTYFSSGPSQKTQ